MPQLFSWCNLFALVGWLLLIVAPRWRWTERLVVSGLWSVLLSVVYLLLMARYLPGAEGGFGSIADVRQLFTVDALLLAGWVHYLAFDLFLGAVEVRQAKPLGIPHLVIVPILVLTFLLGPIGLLLFFIVKSVRQRRLAEVVPS